MAPTVTLEVVSEVRKAVAGINEVSTKLTGLQKIGKSVGPTLKGMLAADLIKDGVGAVIDSVKGAYDTVKEQGRLAAQTEAVLKSTGNAAGVSADQVKALSEAIEGNSVIDAEAVTAGQNLLLTFTNIKNGVGAGNDVFSQTTKTMADMATAMGTDPKNAAMQLGKALNDPVKGISALSRVGVTFTADQKKQIETLVKSGKTMDAQKIILAELNKEFGGSAAASANTFEGAMFQVKDMLDGVLEDGINALMPALTDMANFLKDNLPTAIEFLKTKGAEVVTALEPLGAAIGAVIAFLRDNPETVKAFAITLGILGGIVGVVTVAQWAWNLAMTANPIGLIIVAIALLVAGIVWLVTNWDTVAAAVGPIWETIKNAVVGAVMFIVNGITSFFGGIAAWIQGQWEIIVNGSKIIWAAIVGVIRGHVEAVRNGVNAGISWVRNFVDSAFKFLVGVARTQIELFRRYIVDPVIKARDMVGAAITTVKNAVSTGLSTAANLGKAAFDRLVTSVVSVVNRVIDTVRGIRDRVTGGLSGIGSWLLSAGGDLVRGFVNGITGGIGRAVSAAVSVAQSAVNAAKNALGIHSPSRVFRDEVGDQTVAGLVLALKAGRRVVARTTAGLADSMLEAWHPDALGVTIGAPAITGTPAAGGVGAAAAVYNITVEAAALTDPVAIGRAVVDAVRALERAQGRPAPIGGGAR